MINVLKKSVSGLLASAAILAIAPTVSAKEFPAKPIEVIVPFPAGGSTDLMARATAREMTEIFGQNVVVDNRGGGAGTVGMAALARERPDGYTVGLVPAAPLVNQPHMRRTPYDLDKFDYVCQLFSSPQALAVKPGSQFENLDQLVGFAKQHPGKLTYGTPGPGTLPHLAMERFLQLANVKIEHVPFTGDGPGATALMGGHIDLYMTMTNVVKDRNFAAIAVFSEAPLDSMPKVKTAVAQGYDMTAAWWGGVIAPKGIPEEVKTRLTEGCELTAASDRFAGTLDNLGTEVLYRNPAEFEQYVRDVSETNKQLINSVIKAN